jgi:hypothetical protein
MSTDKVLGDSRILKDERVTIPKKVRGKLSVKDSGLLHYLLTKGGYVKYRNWNLM